MYTLKFKKIVFLFIITIFIFVLGSCQVKNETPISVFEEKDISESQNIEIEAEVGYIGDDLALTYDEMVRTIALSLYDKNEMEKVGVQSEIVVSNISKDDELYNFFAILIENKLIEVKEDFDIYKNVTLEDLNIVLLSLNQNDFTLKLDESNKDKVISYGFFSKLWVKVLESMAENNITEDFGLSYSEEVILATNKENNEIPLENIITDYGVKKISFLNYSNLLNHSVKLLIKDDEIIFATEVTSKTPTIKSAYILDNNKESISIFTGGVNRIYKVKDGIEEDLSGMLCNIVIDDNVALEVTVLGNFISEEVKLISSSQILFENKGVYDMSNNIHTLKFYDISTGEIKAGGGNEVYVGS
ncbi:MAG: hypothetical protein ACK5LY_03795, partial [Lachnospirales bacterium]